MEHYSGNARPRVPAEQSDSQPGSWCMSVNRSSTAMCTAGSTYDAWCSMVVHKAACACIAIATASTALVALSCRVQRLYCPRVGLVGAMLWCVACWTPHHSNRLLCTRIDAEIHAMKDPAQASSSGSSNILLHRQADSSGGIRRYRRNCPQW
jgi:hypothetical protein